MSVVIGIDVGGSTTKIAGFTDSKKLIKPIFVRAADPVTSIYGAFGKFLNENELELENIEKVMVTGAGANYITKPIYGLECIHVSEFSCIGLGGLYLSKLDHAIAVSMGTGTAIVYAVTGKPVDYLGGTGVGGGTIMGLSHKMLGLDNIDSIVDLASKGNLGNIDLMVGDISIKKMIPGMPGDLTASNFGKVSDMASKSDLALGIINMVFESIAMLALFAAKNCSTKDIVLTGNLTTIKQCPGMFSSLSELFKVNFIIPEYAQYATVIGAALSYWEKNVD